MQNPSTASVLTAGFALSRTIDSLLAVAATVAILDSTESTIWVAAVAAARLIPMAVLGVVVVAIVQVSDQRFVLAFSSLIRAIAAVALGLFEFDGSGNPAAIVVATAIASFVSAPYRAGAGRLIATHTPEKSIVRASTAFSRVDYGSVLIAPGLCGVLLLTTDLTVTFMTTAGLALLLAASLLLVPADNWPRPSTARALRQVGSAARLVIAVRDARAYLAVRAAARIALGILGVAIAFFPARAGAQNAHVAFLQAALGFGAMVLALLPGRVPDRGRLRAVLWSIVLMAAAFVLIGEVRSLVFVSIALAAIGAADLALHLASGSALRGSLPTTAAATGSGVADSLVATGMLVGTIACPALIDAFGVDATCLIAAAVVLAATIALLPGLRRANQTDEARRRSAAPVLELLEKCPALDGLAPADLQVLAEAGTAVTIRRGALAVAEGAVADAVYVVRSGTLAVHVSGEDAGRTGVMVTLGPGDLFGEIGVLQGRPRTASVLATDAVELVRLPGPAFIEALMADLGAATAVAAGADERLRRSHPG